MKRDTLVSFGTQSLFGALAVMATAACLLASLIWFVPASLIHVEYAVHIQGSFQRLEQYRVTTGRIFVDM
jgi:hypothetical protein